MQQNNKIVTELDVHNNNNNVDVHNNNNVDILLEKT